MMKSYRFDIVVIGGFGHIGLPFGIVFADAGLQVGLFDIDHSKRKLIESGQMPFLEEGAESLLRRVIGKSLHIVDSLEAVSESDSVVITIGTPVDEYLNPRVLPILKLAEDLRPHLRDGHHIILRSTVYPSTSRRIFDFFTNHGLNVNLSFCPERIVQGRAIQEIRQFPPIVSGFTREAIARSEALFSRLNAKTITVSVEEAEFAKLFSNAWRYIRFAAANQFYMMAAAHGANFDRIRNAMMKDYDRASDFPAPGFAAGPCLLKDTLQLSAFHQGNFQLGQAAMLVNEGLPNFLVDMLRGRCGRDFQKMRMGVLGMAFKADTDDIRDSLSYKLVKILRFHGVDVYCSDEYVQDPTFIPKEKLIQMCDVIIVGVPHSGYDGLRIPEKTIVIDLWNVTQRPE